MTKTNNDPAVTAGFYLNCVREQAGCPVLLVTDPGSENTVMASMQGILRSDGNDEYSVENSHRFLESKRNLVIEAWSYYRKNRSTCLMNFFADMATEGTFLHGHELRRACMWFCFADLIQKDLSFVTAHWNTHYIRRSRFDTTPGIPDALYYLPERSGASDHLVEIGETDIDSMEKHSVHLTLSDPENIHELYFNYIMANEGLNKPQNWQEALDLYKHLTDIAGTTEEE